jgi:hypothetical protein
LIIMLSPTIAALPPVADSCDLLFHDLAIMLPPNIAALPPVADSCGLPVHDLAIMLSPNIAGADSCNLPIHDLVIMLPPNIAAIPLARFVLTTRVAFSYIPLSYPHLSLLLSRPRPGFPRFPERSTQPFKYHLLESRHIA